jgi:hypothetical protein
MFYFRGRLRLVILHSAKCGVYRQISFPADWNRELTDMTNICWKSEVLLVTQSKQNLNRLVPTEICHGLVVLWATQNLWVISEFQSGCERHLGDTSSVFFEIHVVSWLSCVVESSWFSDLYTVYRLNLLTRIVLCWWKFQVTCQLTSSKTQAFTW